MHAEVILAHALYNDESPRKVIETLREQGWYLISKPEVKRSDDWPVYGWQRREISAVLDEQLVTGAIEVSHALLDRAHPEIDIDRVVDADLGRDFLNSLGSALGVPGYAEKAQEVG